jgi:hypothetical protein
MFTLQTSFKPLLLGGGGGGGGVVNSKKENSVSPATPFSDASLPNQKKMFELVHVVTSMDDFDFEGLQILVLQETDRIWIL